MRPAKAIGVGDGRIYAIKVTSIYVFVNLWTHIRVCQSFRFSTYCTITIINVWDKYMCVP